MHAALLVAPPDTERDDAPVQLFGDVWEWTGTTFHAYPGFEPGAWLGYSLPAFGQCKAVRGASFATRSRMKQPRFRAFHPPERDDFFVGFRTCAL